MKKYLLGGVVFFLLVTLCFVLLGVGVLSPEEPVYAVENGVMDLLAADFEKELVYLTPDDFTHYPNQLLSPDQTGTPGGSSLADYGTCRLRLRLPAGGAYTLSVGTNHMAYLVSVNGETLGRWGSVGETANTSQAKAGTLIISFSPETDETEISYQYSSFIRPYRPNGITFGSAGLLSAVSQRLLLRDVLFAACLFTAGLLFFGMFLFFGRKSRYVYFALFCLCLMMEQLVTSVMPLALLFELSAASVARIEYISVLGALISFVLYVNSMFRGVTHKWAGYAATVVFALYAASVLLLSPAVFTGLRVVFLGCAWAIALYGVIMLALRVRRPAADQSLILLGVVLLLVVGLFEQTVLRWVLPYRLANGFMTHCATVGVIFLNMVALSLSALRAERERDEARRRQNELDRIGRMKTEFLATMSHEIKTPLTVMSGYAQRALRQLDADTLYDDTRQGLLTITLEAQRLSMLAEQLLDTAIDPLDTGTHTLEPARILERASALCGPILKKNGNQLHVRVPDNCPAVNANEGMILQVLVNLCVNASRHTRSGEVTISAEPKRDTVEFCVEDNGSGIQPELLSRVFERGISGDGESGLGLSICKDVVESHGGTIWIESIPGAGARVSFTLPIEN